MTTFKLPVQFDFWHYRAAFDFLVVKRKTAYINVDNATATSLFPPLSIPGGHSLVFI